MAALDAGYDGYDVKASGVTLDRFCGSGITATTLAAGQVMSCMEDCVIAGGTEMMSHVIDYGMKMREAKVNAALGKASANQLARCRSCHCGDGRNYPRGFGSVRRGKAAPRRCCPQRGQAL
jgi:Thiolase, N-terminal domain